MFLGYLSLLPPAPQLHAALFFPSSILQGEGVWLLQSQTDWFESQFFLLLSTGAEGTHLALFFPSVSHVLLFS